MGYTTEFSGVLQFSTPLNKDQVAYIEAFNQTRRMKRDKNMVAAFKDELREAVGLPLGTDGEYYVGSYEDGDFGQSRDESIIDYNTPPGEQPGLWCQWTVSEDGTQLMWDEGEKFYDYVEWLQYLIDHFFSPWSTLLNGIISWRGESFDDMGKIIVEDSVITTRELA